MRLLGEADSVVAEVTIPSHGVGYEIGRAVNMSKKILCLYRPQDDKSMVWGVYKCFLTNTRCMPGLSAMIAGMPSEVATVLEYKEDELGAIFEKFFKWISGLNQCSIKNLLTIKIASVLLFDKFSELKHKMFKMVFVSWLFSLFHHFPLMISCTWSFIQPFTSFRNAYPRASLRRLHTSSAPPSVETIARRVRSCLRPAKYVASG